eukprot:CAMPEP_0172765246 /NCGR_PEP_ID=MMETSP1074-20121228/178910_1 /TAXON_ID=2916 /ORGANISM="Ceratium fusus, Strain PA161109" /LENGTH=71 /DNA_ID=CAMNT_0013600163 /DNA_START=771 /DNA_END=982 /DNA_ORIENTATION=+
MTAGAEMLKLHLGCFSSSSSSSLFSTWRNVFFTKIEAPNSRSSLPTPAKEPGGTVGGAVLGLVPRATVIAA